ARHRRSSTACSRRTAGSSPCGRRSTVSCAGTRAPMARTTGTSSGGSRRARTAGSAAPGTWSFPMAVEALGHAPRPPGVLTGRAGSAMAAELGSMTVYDEINALRTMDIDPVRFLVMPRVVAATIALPVLVLYSDFIGVWGGAAVVAADPAITIPVSTYFARMLEWVHFTDFVVGLVKGVVFGMVASLLPCTFGLRTRGGTEGIAASTTAA